MLSGHGGGGLEWDLGLSVVSSNLHDSKILRRWLGCPEHFGLLLVPYSHSPWCPLSPTTFQQTLSFVHILRWTNVGHKLQCGCHWSLNPCQLRVKASTWQHVLPGRSLGAPRTAACSGYPSLSGTASSSLFISCSRLKDAWATVQKVRINEVFISKTVSVTLAAVQRSWYCSTHLSGLAVKHHSQ